jgi:TRAP-type C4-dicarboxylate transport system permease small subunit
MKFEKSVDECIPILSGVLLMIMVVFIFLGIVAREIFSFCLTWCDEASQYCMLWMVSLGSIYLTKRDQHLSTGLKLQQKLNKKLAALIDGFLALVTVSSAVVVAYQCLIYSFSGYKAVSLPWLKMECVYIAVPIFMLALGYYYLKSFFGYLTFIFRKDKPLSKDASVKSYEE